MVTENLFEARFRTVQELARLGADAQVDGHHVMTHGVPLLSGAPVESSDIRSGAALVIAGLVADGETMVSGVHHVDRGYPGFEQAMAALGADVTREPDDEFRRSDRHRLSDSRPTDHRSPVRGRVRGSSSALSEVVPPRPRRHHGVRLPDVFS